MSTTTTTNATSSNRQKRLSNAGKMGLYRLATMAKQIGYGKPEELREAEDWIMSFLQTHHAGDSSTRDMLIAERLALIESLKTQTDTDAIGKAVTQIAELDRQIANMPDCPWCK